MLGNGPRNTGERSDMKYKEIPFNLTLAKRISDGSVRGVIQVINNDGDIIGNAKYLHQNECGHNFSIHVYTGNEEVHHKTETFNDYGLCLCNNGDFAKLVIGIPVEGSYDDDYCNANSGVKEKEEQGKDGHYHKCTIEPIDYILANNLGFCEGNVVKYITRYKDKGGVDDLRKIKVYVDYLIDDLTKQSNN